MKPFRNHKAVVAHLDAPVVDDHLYDPADRGMVGRPRARASRPTASLRPATADSDHPVAGKRDTRDRIFFRPLGEKDREHHHRRLAR